MSEKFNPVYYENKPEKGLRFPVTRSVFGNYILKINYFDRMKNNVKRPDFIKFGENKFFQEQWDEWKNIREQYVLKNKGRLMISIRSLDENYIYDKEDPYKLDLHTDGTDIILIEDVIGNLSGTEFDIVAFSEFDYARTTLRFNELHENDIYKMPYNPEIISLLNTGLSHLFNEQFRDKYSFLDIKLLKLDEARKEIRKKNRTSFLVKKGLTIEEAISK